MRINSLPFHVLSVSAATVALLAPSYAADLVTPSAAPAFSAPVSDAGLSIAMDDWTGFYVGASIGGVTTDDFEEENSAVSGAVQAGYLQQFDSFVLGAEVQGTFSDELNYVLTPDAGLSQSWSVSARGRAGVALGQTLLYGTAGATLAELEPTGATTSGAETHLGAVFGAGIEQSFGQFSVRAEYLQTNYFDVDSTVGGVGRQDDLTDHAFMLGANFRF